jgi:hypothetical protein
VLTNALIHGRQSGRKNLWAGWIEAWLGFNPGKTLFVARAARGASVVLKQESEDFISVRWVKDKEPNKPPPMVISYDESWVYKRFMDAYRC